MKHMTLVYVPKELILRIFALTVNSIINDTDSNLLNKCQDKLQLMRCKMLVRVKHLVKYNTPKYYFEHTYVTYKEA